MRERPAIEKLSERGQTHEIESTLHYQEIYHLTNQHWGNQHPKNHFSNVLLIPTAHDAYLFREEVSRDGYLLWY